VPLSAELRNAQPIHDNWRRRREESGPGTGEIVLAPQLFSGGGIETGEGATNTECYDLSIGNCRGTARPGVSRGRSCRALSGVLFLPQLLSGAGVQAESDFVGILSREDVELITDQRRRGIALAHGDVPFLRQFLGPGFGRSEAGHFRIAIRPPPLRPILRP